MSYENLPKNLTNQAVLVRGARPDYLKLDADAFPSPTANEAGAILEVTDTGDRFRWSSTVWYQITTDGRANVNAVIDSSQIPLKVDIDTQTANPLFVQTELVKAAFGELLATKLTPLTQISAQYGLLTGTFVIVDPGPSGTATVVDEKFTCQTGVAADGLASILTRKQLAYRAGQGARARFTSIFGIPVVDSTQAAGLITAENSFAFGYIGTDFGIFYAHGGVVEVQELTVTIPGGTETATVTVDGTPYVVPLTNTGTVQGVAYEIAVSLNAQVPNYVFTSNDDQVVALSVLAGPRGAFAFSSTGTAVAAWAQLIAGVDTTTVFIPQANWNVDIKADLDPTLGNVYQINFQYLGFGAIDFYVEDSDTGKFVLVHRIKFANTSVNTSVTNPTFRVGWLATNTGNTTNVTVQGASAAAFIEGDLIRSGPTNSDSNNQIGVGTGALTSLLAVRNRINFGNKVNRSELLLKFVSLSSQTNQTAFFQILVNPTFSAPVVWEYVDKGSSTAEITKDNVNVTGGDEIAILTVTDGAPASVVFTDATADGILPGSVICIAAIISSGAAADCQATMTWQEDI